MPNDPQGESQSPESQTPSYVRADEIGNIVNSAVSSHLKRSLASAIEAALKPVVEGLKTQLAPPPAPSSEEEPGNSRKKQSPELLAMAKKVEDMEKALADSAAKVAAAEKKSQEQRAYTELRGALEGKVRPELLDMVAQHLFTVEKRVDFDESGTPLFKATKVAYTGAEPEEFRLPLRNGVEEFLKGEAAKPFLPAPNSGSGAGPLQKRAPVQSGGTDFSKPATTDAERIQRAAERARLISEKTGIR